ncbi:MAG: hypothetical protein RMJ84_03875 [Sandaracinaceae bacterium]|nr:hypothetical protein [Sandaracinaceae bacterium]
MALTGTRCAFHPEFLHPLERYANALDGLRLDRRFPVVVAAITASLQTLLE